MNPRIRSDIYLGIASLFIAFVIWLIARQGDLDSDWLTATLEVENVPGNMTVEAPRNVSINVQYPIELSNRIVEKNFLIPIDVRSLFSENPKDWEKAPQAPKLVDYKLTPQAVRKLNLPEMVQVVDLDPPQISLSARLRTQQADVDVRTTGSLPAHLDLTGPLRPDPARVIVTGSQEALQKLAERNNRVPTTPIDLSTLQRSGVAYPRLELPPGLQLIGVNEGSIAVEAAVEERAVRQAIEGVPIQILPFTAGLTARVTPATASIVLEGPSSALAMISGDDFVFTPSKELIEQAGRSQEVGIEARLKATVPNDIASQLTIRECQPPRITVEFLAVDQQNGGASAP